MIKGNGATGIRPGHRCRRCCCCSETSVQVMCSVHNEDEFRNQNGGSTMHPGRIIIIIISLVVLSVMLFPNTNSLFNGQAQLNDNNEILLVVAVPVVILGCLAWECCCCSCCSVFSFANEKHLNNSLIACERGCPRHDSHCIVNNGRRKVQHDRNGTRLPCDIMLNVDPETATQSV